jgi:hypothetical protein
LRNPGDRDRLLELLAGADVIVHATGPVRLNSSASSGK